MGLINWEHILLDTTVLIRVLDYKKNKKAANEFYNSLIEFFANTDAQIDDKKTRKRKFYLSAITIAEILDPKMVDDIEKSKQIIQALNTNNLEIISFDEDASNVFNFEFIKKLGVNFPSDIISKWGIENSKPNREMLTKDLMILACAKLYNVDAVLCVDKGMFKIGKEFGLNMVYVDPKYFDYNSSSFFHYNSAFCDKELLDYE